MFQRNTVYTSSLRACLRPLSLFLYFCLVVSLIWYESSFSPSVNFTSTPTIVAGHFGKHAKSSVNQGSASRRLPSLLAPAPKLPSSTRLRPENRNNDLPPLQICGALAGDTLCLSSLRIDPVAWESRTPSFLLPSSHGLVPFAIPPPFRPV